MCGGERNAWRVRRFAVTSWLTGPSPMRPTAATRKEYCLSVMSPAAVNRALLTMPMLFHTPFSSMYTEDMRSEHCSTRSRVASALVVIFQTCLNAISGKCCGTERI